jgi:capsular exopolysaccharide synthesis family protein
MQESNYHQYRGNPNNRLPALPAPYLPVPAGEIVVDGGPPAPRPEYGRLIRKYIVLGILLVLLGAGAGFVSVAFFAPLYRARAVIEIQSGNDSFLKMRQEGGDESISVNIQTQIQLLRSVSFLRKVVGRLQLETVPPAPVQSDIFTKMRNRLKTVSQEPMAVMKDGLEVAAATLQARPITGTRIIEVTCESTNPEIASDFVNAVANEYAEQSLQGRMKTAQQAGQWLNGELEETKTRLQDAQQRLQDFVRTSGNLFVLQDNTLADTKLRELQAQVAAVQNERIAKQAKFELVEKTPAASLPDVLDDPTLRGYQARIAELRQQTAALETTLLPANPKVQKVLAQMTELQATLNKEIAGFRERVSTEYQAALRREKLLKTAYDAQAGQVSGQATKATQYGGLKREVDSLQQLYNTMLLQANETNIAGQLPINQIQVVDPSSPATAPYSPKPAVNILLGMIAGLMLSGAIAYLWEKRDNSVRLPGHARILLNVPELGVIPSVKQEGGRKWRFGNWNNWNNWNKDGSEEANREFVQVFKTAQSGQAAAFRPAESFRVTLASLLRESVTGGRPQAILVTSPSPAEGKTTVASNLGMALAETGRNVLLVDGDFRRPRLHHVFDLPNNWGLTSLLADGANMQEVVGMPTAFPGLSVLPSGPAPESISKILYSPALRQFFNLVRTRFDIILIDAPPILEVADARVLGEFADGAVLVLRAGSTDRSDALEACQHLQEDGTLLLGTVLNDWKPPRRSKNYYEYYAGRRED